MRISARSSFVLLSMVCLSSMLTSCPGGGGGGGNGNGGGTGGGQEGTGEGERVEGGGRIPSCLDDDGIDFFMAEGDEVLSLSWNNVGRWDHAGGYRVRFGFTEDVLANEEGEGEGTGAAKQTVEGEGEGNGEGEIDVIGPFAESIDVDCFDLQCEFNLEPLVNGVSYSIVIDALGGNGEVTQSSCTISGAPHVLAFLSDLPVNDLTEGTQELPSIAVQEDGTPLFIAWEDQGVIRMSRSNDLGDVWSESTIPIPDGADQKGPILGFRDLVEPPPAPIIEGSGEGAGEGAGALKQGEGETEGETDEGLPPYLFMAYQDGDDILVARAGFLEPTLEGVGEGMTEGEGEGEGFNIFEQPLVFETPITVGTGSNPTMDVIENRIHIAWEDNTQIWAAWADPDEMVFSDPIRVDTVDDKAFAPSIAANPFNEHVFVGYDASRGAGDTNVYVNTSENGGLNFRANEVRIDDDTKGQNQLNISMAVDGRTGQVLATWEDRRGGANVFFSASNNNALSWDLNIRPGTGLTGDQFRPKAVVDPGRNVYVIFQDTTNGQRPLFSRFNPDGTFDPPLVVSEAAGRAGTVGDNPDVVIDNFGTIYVTWDENRDSPDVDIYFARAE